MRKRRPSGITLLLLAALVGGLGWTVYTPIRQERLNRALIAAIKQNDTKQTLSLLAEGANPNVRDEPPQHLSLWRLLLDTLRGKRPAPSTAPTALLLACSWYPHDNPLLVKALLDRGAQIEAKENDGATPLLIAVILNKVQVSRLLIARGANVNVIDRSGESSPLREAVSNDNKVLARMLINKGADVNFGVNVMNFHSGIVSPLEVAKDNGDKQIIQMLKQAGAKE